MANYNTQLKRFVKICKEKEVAFLIILNKSQIYSEYIPTLHVRDNYKRTKRYVDYLKNNSDININYIFDELNYAKYLIKYIANITLILMTLFRM